MAFLIKYRCLRIFLKYKSRIFVLRLKENDVGKKIYTKKRKINHGILGETNHPLPRTLLHKIIVSLVLPSGTFKLKKL